MGLSNDNRIPVHSQDDLMIKYHVTRISSNAPRIKEHIRNSISIYIEKNIIEPVSIPAYCIEFHTPHHYESTAKMAHGYLIIYRMYRYIYTDLIEAAAAAAAAVAAAVPVGSVS